MELQPAQGDVYRESVDELGDPRMTTWRDEGRVLTIRGKVSIWWQQGWNTEE